MASKLPKFKIVLRGDGSRSKVYKDGQELKALKSVSVQQEAGELPLVYLSFYAGQVEIDVGDVEEI